MRPLRRRFLRLAAGAAAIPVVPRSARAQDYPARPVRLLVGFAAGGPTDVFARLLADLLSARWGGRPVIVENRPGAGTILATAAVAKAPPDGYTLMVAAGGSFMINPALGQKLPYDPFDDFTPVGMILLSSIVLVANNDKSFPPNSIPELVAAARRAEPPLNFASPGPRSNAHLVGEMLKQRAGIAMQHINYNGSAPALTDVIGGRVPLMFDAWQSAKQFVDTGQLKAIAMASTSRLPDAPHVPTIAETYPGFSSSGFSFIVGPAGIPAPILETLSADLRAVVDSREFAAKMRPLGAQPRSSSPQELGIAIRAEIEKWSAVAKAAGIKPD
jgi:tripartite-type tricarboxylate transporter receptor subunit TctC